MSAGERRILLIGADGQVGHELQRTLAPLARVTPATRRDADLRDADALRRLVDVTRPHAILLAAAYTDVDGAEADRATAHAVNAEAPRILAESCARAGTLLVHFSTDYVFDGTASIPYREADATAPLSVYGESKRAGEGFDVADADRGLYHLTAAGAASWHAFAVAILELWPDILRPGTRVSAIRSDEFPRPARRPAYSVLDNTRVAEHFGIRMPHWREQLRLLLAQDAAPTDSPPPHE